MNWYRRLDAATVAALLLLALITVLALGADWLFDASPWAMVAEPLIKPFSDPAYPLGTDMLGRDIAAAIVFGARMSLLVGVVSTAVALLLGVVVGALSGYFGGIVDDVLMGVTEFFQIIPPLAMALVLVAVLTPSLGSMIGAIAIVSWPPLARLVRGEFLSLRNREFVQAAIVIGQRPLRIIFTQILPNALAPIIASTALLMGGAILAESALSFLGLGVPDVMSWGFMVGAARNMIRDAWWMSVWPGAAILLTTLAISVAGDGLRQALDRSASGARRPPVRETREVTKAQQVQEAP